MERQEWASRGPVIIGGVGGSGTRVIAEILSALRFYMGSDLNVASDNLWFTLLFKRPKWHQRASYNPQKISTGFDILSKAMLHAGSLSFREMLFLLNATVSMAPTGHSIEGHGRGKWPFERAWKLIKSTQKGNDPGFIGWGWKEPNTHVYIDDLAANYRNLKYILTIRHGLDMAFSSNQTQLFNWAPFYGVELPKQKSDIPRASLKYWIKANQRALEAGKRLGPDKFLLVNFDQLCLSPQSEIKRIISFLNIQPSSTEFANVITIPKVPSSYGRHRAHDPNQFDSDDLDLLRTLELTTSQMSSDINSYSSHQ